MVVVGGDSGDDPQAHPREVADLAVSSRVRGPWSVYEDLPALSATVRAARNPRRMGVDVEIGSIDANA